MTKNTKSASQIRKRLKEIPDEFHKDLDVLIERRELFKGYVYRSFRRCGKASCRCTRGELHEAWVVAADVDGKRTTRSLSGESRRTLSKLATNYRRFRKAQRSLRRRCKELIGLVRELEELMYVEPFEREKKGKGGKGR